jgi:hypothetical protein
MRRRALMTVERMAVAYFQMAAIHRADGTLIYLRTHRRAILKSGHRLDSGFEQPVVVKLDDEHANGRLPTFYESPAFIGRMDFHKELLACGVSNIEVVPVIIKNDVAGTECHDYVLMNIVGRVSCADMGRSRYRSLGPGMMIIDDLVLKDGESWGLDLFIADEDTDMMIVSERVKNHISKLDYPDILFRAL